MEMAAKSKLSRLFTAGNLASLIRRSMVRRSRSIISSSVSVEADNTALQRRPDSSQHIVGAKHP
jgi:hypothetical protein